MLSLLGEIVDALPTTDITRLIFEVFITRCQAPLGNVVHTPSFMADAEELFASLSRSSREDKVKGLLSIPMDLIACCLLVVCIQVLYVYNIS